ncbi:MAG: response regulator [Mycobacteriales bacterium]
MTGPAVTVLLADDQPLVRTGLRMILQSGRCEVVGEASDGTEALALAAELRPDVVLMDIRMPGMDGVAATRELVARDPAARVLMLTTFDLDELVVEALRAGAKGFLPKDVPADDLLTGVRAVAAGDTIVAPKLLGRLLGRFLSQPEPVSARTGGVDTFRNLTARETDVLRLMATGMSNTEIAAALGVAETTVKTHVGGILAKLGARDRVQAVVLAYQHGLVQPG